MKISDNDARLDREREFHNERYKQDVRSLSVGRFYVVAQPWLEIYRDRLLTRIAGARVLEYGVGTGGYGFSLAKQGALVTGIDISETAVAIAKADAIKRGLEMDFKVMNAEEMSFEDKYFDVVCGTGILHHLDLRKAIPEIRRVLRPGGFALFLEPLGHNALINGFRRRTPAIRTTDEHPLLKNDLQLMGSHFERCRTEYFGLATLGMAFAGPLRGSSILRRFLEGIDRVVLSVPLLRYQAWMVLIELGDHSSSLKH
jgi:ubiquinone/menaquinone biosynthesis C-methylase UbiE